jgi:RNA polymerase sigma-54 factor
MIRQVQQNRLMQKLSPQQIQLVKLLEIPSLEMNDRIMQEVDENPALELGENLDIEKDEELIPDDGDDGGNDDFSLEEYASDDDIPDYRIQMSQGGATEEIRERLPSNSNTSLNEFLLEQLRLHELNDEKSQIAEFIVGNIDEDGYLRSNAGSIADDLAIIRGIEVSNEEIEELILLIKQLDPPGVGASDLKECLLLQLERRTPSKIVNDSILMLENYFEDFAKKHYESILRKMDCSMEDLRLMIQEIVRLNPKPGSAFESSLEQSMKQVSPDFILENNDGFLSLTLNNSNIPELHISRKYIEMVNDFKANTRNRTKESKDAIQFAKEKVDSARWFIDSVRQRQETLMRTMQAIVDYQYEYFIDGDEKNLKPMILKDIACKTGYDISTISRVSNSKYIQTEFGIFPLKYFFTEGMQTDSGEEVSALEIKTILQQSVNAEDKTDPLTDEQLSVILSGKGYVIARRTIAKYRDQLGIPVARLRREL